MPKRMTRTVKGTIKTRGRWVGGMKIGADRKVAKVKRVGPEEAAAIAARLNAQLAPTYSSAPYRPGTKPKNEAQKGEAPKI